MVASSCTAPPRGMERHNRYSRLGIAQRTLQCVTCEGTVEGTVRHFCMGMASLGDVMETAVSYRVAQSGFTAQLRDLVGPAGAPPLISRPIAEVAVGILEPTSSDSVKAEELRAFSI